MHVGFIGIGTMGAPMATRLLDAGIPLRVWNRTPGRCAPLVARGAVEAPGIDALFATSTIVLLMLLNQQAVDAVLARGQEAFATRVRGRTLVMLGTTSAEYSQALETDVRRHGGRYVEAPVSGSRGPAEEGSLVGMLAGEPSAVADIAPLLQPLCRQMVHCGEVPSALRMKLAVNHYLVVLVAALAEAAHAAARSGVDLQLFREVLDAGPMASPVSRAKLQKLVSGDFGAQAAIRDVAVIAELVRQQASVAGIETPLIDTACRMYQAADQRGLSDLDMAALLEGLPASPSPADA